MENQKIENLKKIYNKLTDLYHEAEEIDCSIDIEGAIGQAENVVEAEIRREKLKGKLEFKVEWLEGYGDIPPTIKTYRELEDRVKEPFNLEPDFLEKFFTLKLGDCLEHGDPSGLVRFTLINNGKQKIIDLEE